MVNTGWEKTHTAICNSRFKASASLATTSEISKNIKLIDFVGVIDNNVKGTMNFKDKTCKDCKFRNGCYCVLNPPTVVHTGNFRLTIYPEVFVPAHTETPYKESSYDVPDNYGIACSKYEITT